MITHPPVPRRTGFIGPMAAGARPQKRPQTVVRLWLPLTVIALLLAPFAVMAAPLLYLVPRPWRGRPLPVVLAIGRVLLALGGTEVDVRTRDAIVRLKIV